MSKIKIYTKQGDQGKTYLPNGSRVYKFDPRLDACGLLDELNCSIGLLVVHVRSLELSEAMHIVQFLELLQSDIFILGSYLLYACNDDVAHLSKIDPLRLGQLESYIDTYASVTPELKNFILPGGSQASALGHVCRTKTRNFERALVFAAEQSNSTFFDFIPYVNRMSDYFFALARYLNFKLHIADTIWKI